LNLAQITLSLSFNLSKMTLSNVSSLHHFHFRTEPDGKSCLGMNGNACPWPRGKVIGGSSVINGMLYVRGVREDYDTWARLGNQGKDEAISSVLLELMKLFTRSNLTCSSMIFWNLNYSNLI
jgi:choline dehydrogenase-like flavoprotein